LHKLTLTWDQGKLFDRLTRAKFPEDVLEKELFGKGERKNLPGIHETGYVAALKFMERKDRIHALSILKVLLESYLWRDLSECSEGTGKCIIETTNIIVRAWTAVHADCLKNRLSAPDEFRTTRYVHTDIWSNVGLMVLGITGELSDLSVINILGKKCEENGMQVNCGRALRAIVSREAILYALSVTEPEELGGFLRNTERYSQRQLVARIERIFDVFGIDAFIASIGSSGGTPISYGPIDRLYAGISLGGVYETGLNRIFGFGDTSGHIADGKIVAAFLLEQRLALKHKKEKIADLELTEKGKEFVRFLMRKIFGLEQIHAELPAGVAGVLEAHAREMLPGERKELE